MNHSEIKYQQTICAALQHDNQFESLPANFFVQATRYKGQSRKEQSEENQSYSLPLTPTHPNPTPIPCFIQHNLR